MFRHSLLDVLQNGPILTLDRVSFVADVLFPSHLSNVLANDLGIKARQSAPYPYQTSVSHVAGIHISFADPSADVPAVRFDFNPAKMVLNPKKILWPYLFALKNVRITRLDFAVDYPSDLSGCFFSLINPVKTTRYFSPSGKLETLYLGAPGSSSRFRIYDKALESKIYGQTLWRVEVQQNFGKDDRPSLDVSNPFHALTVSFPVPDGLSFTRQVMFLHLLAHPSDLSKLSKQAASEYQALLKQATPDFLLSPVQVYEEQHRPFAEFVNWLTMARKKRCEE